MSVVIWYLDRAAGLLAYPSLTLAVLTGIGYNSPSFGVLHAVAQRVHIEVSVFAMIVTLLHALIGVVDTWNVLSGEVPPPAYSLSYFSAGVIVGGGALLLLVVAVLGFTDPGRFSRPWGPRVVHTFAYGGFIFGTIHAAAIGTDIPGLIIPVLGSTAVFISYVLCLRVLVQRGMLPGVGVNQ